MVNLVIIDCHDLGQHLGVYGWETVRSPHLDAIAKKGVRFENSFCTAPQCSPSRAALYTGRYPHANGMFGLAHDPFNWRLYPGEIHLAQYLREAGYETTLIGFQHVTRHEPTEVQKLGFDHVLFENDAERVGDLVENHLRQTSRQPFMLNIGFWVPHRDENGAFKQAPPDSTFGVQVPLYLPQTPEASQEFAQFQGVIHQMDRVVGRIWSLLEDLLLLKNTWLIFTTDHGIAMPRAKCTLHDAGIETALIMYAEPFNLTGGKVFYEMISNVDLVPTILEMLNLPQPGHLHGRSFERLLSGDAYEPREHIFAEKTFHTAYEPQRAIRTERYKLIWNVEVGIMNVPGDIMRSPIFPQMINSVVQELPPFELYDLLLDPLEYRNLIAEPEYADLARDLKAKLLQWMRETGDPILQSPVSSPFYRAALNSFTKEAQ